jgi:hypothetical protein
MKAIGTKSARSASIEGSHRYEFGLAGEGLKIQPMLRARHFNV